MVNQTEYESARERRLAVIVYKKLAAVRLPIDDASVLLEGLFRENGFSSIVVNHQSVPLSRARGYLPGYADAILTRYGLPSEPMNEPDLNIEVPSLPEVSESEKSKEAEKAEGHNARELTRSARKNIESRLSKRFFKEEEADKFYDVVREHLYRNPKEVHGKITVEPFGMSSKRRYEILRMVLEETGVQSKDQEEFFSVGLGNVRFYLKDFQVLPVPGSSEEFTIRKKETSLEEAVVQP